MTAPDTAAACEAIRCNMRESVAHEISIGARVAELSDLFANAGVADQFPGFCGEELGIPHFEALLLARWAADRPAWANPEAVDLSDPLANELLELAIRHTTRTLGMPPADLEALEVAQ